MNDFSLTLAALDFLSPEKLIADYGTIGVAIIIFAESCFAFFLPGDSLLAVAGFFASKGDLNLAAVCISATVAAIAGNQVGYAFGRKTGPALFARDSRMFRKKHLDKTHEYFEKNGPKTIVLARFVPIVRTFACVIAGVAKMDYKLFLTYNIVGAVLWGTGVTVVGYILGEIFGEAIDIDKYLLPFIAVVILISFIPFFVEMYKARKEVKEAAQVVKEEVEELLD